MTLTNVTARTVRRHVLDIVTVLAHDGVDMLREAANAPAAGDDWFRLCPHTGRLLAPTPELLVTVVEPVVLDGPLEAHITFDYQTLGHAPLRRKGRATLRLVAMATGSNPWTEVTVLVSARPRVPGLAAPRWAREATERFLTSLARRIEHALGVLPAAP